MSALTPDQILDKAAVVLPDLGHFKGDYYDGDFAAATGADSTACPVCALGALIVAGGRPPHLGIRDSLPIRNAAVALRQFLGLGGNYIAAISDWNDAPERTAAEVVTAFKACAADLRAKATR